MGLLGLIGCVDTKGRKRAVRMAAAGTRIPTASKSISAGADVLNPVVARLVSLLTGLLKAVIVQQSVPLHYDTVRE